MCSFYDVKIKSSDMEKSLGFKISPQFEIETQVYPGHKSFILIHGENEFIADESIYSLTPAWAQDKVKFATYNARVETLFEKPTWINPIRFKRCLVPINAFYESIYEKEYAGHVVRFSQKDNQLIYAAGIWETFINPQTKNISNGFAIITRTPYQFIEEAGHDRSPIILSEESFTDWLSPKINNNKKNILEILNSQKDDISFKAEIVRELKGHNKNQLKLF